MTWRKDSYLAVPFYRKMCFRHPCFVHKMQRKMTVLVGYFSNASLSIHRARFSFVLQEVVLCCSAGKPVDRRALSTINFSKLFYLLSFVCAGERSCIPFIQEW